MPWRLGRKFYGASLLIKVHPHTSRKDLKEIMTDEFPSPSLQEATSVSFQAATAVTIHQLFEVGMGANGGCRQLMPLTKGSEARIQKFYHQAFGL
jgi:hypothetical protein